jgi:succinate dehydrogenase / fumarate reductase, membrane anchor subunit
MSIKSPLAKVKHLGSAKSGTNHFMKQRVTAIFMIPLIAWFVIITVSLLSTSAYDLPWVITSPFAIIGAVLFIITFLCHAGLGMQTIIEDYVHCEVLRLSLSILIKAVCYVSMAAGIISVFTIYMLTRVM